VLYRERFIRDGEPHYPDEIWVGDSVAEARAKEVFGELPVRLVENPYFNDIRSELARLPDARLPRGDKGLSVLYVCEPKRALALRQFGDERHFGYVEEEALRYFLENCDALGAPVSLVRVRPHPSEPQDKYNWALRGTEVPVQIGGQRTLAEEIVDSDVVVGCESMAMIVGMLAGKRVISSIPPSGSPCNLPQPEIEHLRNLVRQA
jgi:hypothetical protein